VRLVRSAQSSGARVQNRLFLGLALLVCLLPVSAVGLMLTTHRPESDDERWFERVVRHHLYEVREKLRATPLRPVINVFSTEPRRSCVVLHPAAPSVAP